MVKRHKGDTETFEGLTFAEQAKSINAIINNLERSVRAHVRKARAEGRDPQVALQKCADQIQRLLGRLTA